MAKDATKVNAGPATVSVNGVAIGHTTGGVEVMYEPTYVDAKVDQYGETIVERFLSGEKLTAKVPLAQEEMSALQYAIPLGQTTGQKLQIGRSAGARLSEEAVTLVIHPDGMGSDKTLDIIIWKAAVASSVTINRKPDEQTIYEVTFEGMVDESRSDGNLLGMIGDSSA